MNLPPWDFSKRNSHFEKVQSEKYFHASVLEVARGLYDWCVNTVCMRNITVFHGVNSVLEVARESCELLKGCLINFYAIELQSE